MKILFTSVGRRVELMQAFRQAAMELNRKLTIIGADITDTAPALFFCDETKVVCPIKEPAYIPQLLAICQEEKVDCLIPTIDTDLLLLAENKRAFEEIGTKVLISSVEKVALCRDKNLTADYFASLGLESPKPVNSVEKYQGGFPAFIKPKDGSSSIDAYKVQSVQELEAYAQKIGDYIIQPFISGKEYTIDIFCDYEGNPVYITPRERLAVRAGEVLKTQIQQDEVMIAQMQRLIADYKPCGQITVQLIQEEMTGENYYIEINPRFGGGAPLSMKAGADSAKAVCRMLSGETLEYCHKAAKDGVIYSRFDQSICVSENRKPKRSMIHHLEQALEKCMQYEAVIFDLDDTLYAEKDYVKSGFQAVAAMLPELPDAEQKLWKAFEQGQSAIDRVLQQARLYSEERKQQCLRAYREHIPQIKLYDEARNLLEELKAAGKKIGIITDGRPGGQRNKIHQLGLEQYVQEIIITDELAGNSNPQHFRKPSAISFEIMKNRWQCAYEDMVYVGDNAAKDFTAPESLGMGTIWFQNVDGLYYNEV